jgi:superfamily II DNA or RNA helicase
MKLPSLQELKRSGQSALKKVTDPSALERGLQYLRDSGFQGFEIATLGSKGHLIEFKLDEPTLTKIEVNSPSTPIYSECNCSMSGYGIFCKHQAIAAWVVTLLASQNYELVRVDEPVIETIRALEGDFAKLRVAVPQPVPPPPQNFSSDTPDDSGAPRVYVPQAHSGSVVLEGMVFCFPNHPIQESLRLLEFTTKLPHASNHQDALLPDLAVPFHRESDLPHPLWRSPVSFRGTTNNLFQNPHELLRRKSIHYLFSDHTRIPVSEILFHRNSTAVPTQLLPVASNIEENFLETKRLRFFPKSQNISVWDYRADERLDAILLAVSKEAAKLHKRDKLKLYFSTPEVLDSQESATEISVLEFTSPAFLKSGFQLRGIEDGTGTLKSEISLDLNSEWLWFSTFAIHPQSHHVFFHPFNQWLEHYPPKIQLESHGSFEMVFNRMQDEFHANLNEIHAYPPFEFLKAESFTPHVRVFSNGTFSLEVTWDFGIIDGIPLPILKQLQVLTLGIRAWNEPLSEQMFAAKKQAKRSNDLRLLRHIGIAAVVFQESIRYFIKKDKPFDAFFDQLKIKLAQLMNKLEGAPASQNTTLEIFCSKAAIEYLQAYIQDLRMLFEENPFPLVLQERNLLVSGVYAFYLKFLFAWISASQTASQGTVLLKTKDGVIQNPAFETPEKIRDIQYAEELETGRHEAEELRARSQKWIFLKKDASAETLIRAFLPLQNEGVIISLDDQSIEELHDEDFISEFILEETPDQQGRIDWFELHPKFFFKGTEISEEQAKKLSETGMITFQGKIYRLNSSTIPSLEKLTLFWEQLAQSQGPKRGGKKMDRIYRLPKHYTLELLALRSTGVRVKGGPIWDQIVNFYDTINEDRAPLPLPPTFKGDLKPYQHRGVQWVNDLYRLGLGGILADDMGLGKTVQTLVFLEMLRLNKELGHTLICVPTSLTFNWFSEGQRFTPDLPMLIFQSRELPQAKAFLAENPHGILISTYGLMAEHEAFFSTIRWNIHIYDEAQNLKTITAKRTTVSRKIAARFKLCLTGTPLENHMGEFYSLMDLVVPGSLGPFDQFRKTYMQSYAPELERMQYLKLKTRPLVLRRTKSAILKELPAKTESTVKIPFTEKQLAIYRDIALSWNSRVRQAITDGGESKSQLIMLTALLRLRQVCSAPSAIPNIDYTEIPPKISLLVDNLKNIMETGESALVFTQFLGTFDLLAREFKKAGIPFFSLHGKVSRKDREIQLQSFTEYKAGAVMLMTLKTGGVGLNLTKASYVFHLEPWWNPAVENQATDRTHRIGQTKPVQVYRYIMSESVEEKIEILKTRKSSQFNALFSDVETLPEVGQDSGNFHLTQKDFEYLLGV